MSLRLDNNIINQKQTPAFYSDILANRPSFGYLGRIFISTDSGQIFEDTGTSWTLIADAGVGGGTLSSVCLNGNTTATGIVITAGGLSTNSLTDTTLTNGSVIFADSGGLLTQSNASFFWDNTNKRLGIGTNSPSATLDVHGTGVNAQFNGTGTNNAYLQFQNAGTNKWRIGNTYNAGANTLDIINNSLSNTALSFNITTNAATFNNSITATSFIKTGGTSSQFLKADGSVDSNSYITLGSLSATSPVQYNNTTGVISILQAGASQAGYLSSTDWNTFNNKASLGSLSASSPLLYNSGTGAFSIQVANSGQSGYLSNTDWNTFNNKQNTITTGNLTETSSSILTISGGTGAVIGSGTTIAVQQSSATTNGYLSSTDWNTFNNKATPLNGVGFVKVSGTTISYDNSTYYLASNPSNFITLSSLAASSPLVYNNTSGGFSIQVATTSQNGYLSSTDWNTFNNKQSALTNPITGTGTTNYLPKFTGTSTIGNSGVYEGTSGFISIGNTNSTYNLDVTGTGRFSRNDAANVSFTIANAYLNQGNLLNFQQNNGGTTLNAFIGHGGDNTGNFVILNNGITALSFAKATGAATFSSSVTAGATFLANTASVVNYALGSAGANFGQIYPNGSTAWSLGYGGSSSTIGTAVLTWNSAGNVGIGTNTSTVPLLVSSTAAVVQQITGSNTGGTILYLTNTSTGGDTFRFFSTGSSNGEGAGKLLIAPITGAGKFLFSGTGTLGINTNTVGSTLQVNGNAAIGYSASTAAPTNGLAVSGTVLIGTTTNNGQGTLQNTGQTFTGGLGIGGLTFSTNTTATVNTSFYFFNGGAGISLTLPDTNGQSMIYYIKNYSASPLTIARTGSNTFIAAGTITTVTSLTLATGVSTIIIGNGTSNYIQIQ